MFKPLPFAIGLRYVRAKRRNGFISFMSLVSMLGIALGVMVLITVLSVMNGFDREIKSRILNMVPQVTVSQYGGVLADYQSIEASLKTRADEFDIVAMAPFIQGEAMLTGRMSNPSFVFLQGIDPTLQDGITPLGQKMLAGRLANLEAGKFNIILGKDLAEDLHVTLGDKVAVYVPKATLTPAGMVPRLKQFTVAGIFNVGYQFDTSYALINIQDAATLLQMGQNVSGIQLKLRDLYQAGDVAARLNASLPGNVTVYTWIDQNANFFQALKMEKMMMFLILLLIIAVAAFNMLSSLVMLVTDKEADIAILRTIGFSSKEIMLTFMVQGMVIGLIGILLGVALGILLSLNVTSLVNDIQQFFNIQFISDKVYFINFLPSQLQLSDVFSIIGITLLLSFLATLYPAYRASRIQPAQALRYE